MMVPRSFAYKAAPPMNDKSMLTASHPKTAKNLMPKQMGSRPSPPKPRPSPPASLSTSPEPTSASSSPSAFARPVTPTDPLEIPSRRSARTKDATPSRRPKQVPREMSNGGRTRGNRSESIELLLSETMIPPRRAKASKNRKSQRHLPNDYVENFSRLLMEDLDVEKDASAASSFNQNASWDALLSPPDAFSPADSPVGSCERDLDLDVVMSERSLSSDSVPSLDYDNESTASWEPNSTPPNSRRATPERKLRLASAGENCISDHPLLHRPSSPPPTELSLQEVQVPLPATPSKAPRKLEVFKSNLTASIRAVRSVAQSTFSNFNASAGRRELMLNQTIFSFSPELTDERRPPPTQEPPSPALRRYLNPASLTVSPSEMHTYHENPRGHSSSRDKSKTPAAIQLQTCYRDLTKFSETASAPPVFLPASVSSSDPAKQLEKPAAETSTPATVPGARQREPRENGDFLRMVVGELGMRRAGKFRDDIPVSVRMWLPPRKSIGRTDLNVGTASENKREIPARWIGITVDA